MSIIILYPILLTYPFYFQQYIYIYVYMYICIYVYMYICIYVYMYICIYIYIYRYIYIHAHEHHVIPTMAGSEDSMFAKRFFEMINFIFFLSSKARRCSVVVYR